MRADIRDFPSATTKSANVSDELRLTRMATSVRNDRRREGERRRKDRKEAGGGEERERAGGGRGRGEGEGRRREL